MANTSLDSDEQQPNPNQKQPSFSENPLYYDGGDAVDSQNVSETNQKETYGNVNDDGDGDELKLNARASVSKSASVSLLSSWSAPEIFDSAGDGNLEALKRLLLMFSSSVTGNSNSSRNAGNDAAFSNDVPSFSPLYFLNQLRDKKGSTPLHYAAGNGHLEVCRFLLLKASAETEHSSPKRNSRNAASCAIRSNSSRTSSNNSDATASSYANTPNLTQGRTALHWAARNGHLSVCKIMVEEFGADPDPLARGGVTPLQLAVWRGHVDICLWLSEKGTANKHFVNGWGCTVHHWLAKSPIYSEEKKHQMKRHQQHHVHNGTFANHRSSDSIPKAATSDAEDRLLALCKWLDDNNEERNPDSPRRISLTWSRPNDHGQTPLHKAGFGGNMPVLKFLVETKGCSDTQRDSQHNTAADCAERNQQWEAAKFLRRQGNPGCLQRARAVLFPGWEESPGALPPPALSDIRSSYIKLARLYHPDRMGCLSKHTCGNQITHTIKTIHAKNFAEESLWKDLQEAYQLWTLWWNDPEEADAMIRGMERHHFLQGQLPLLILWHEKWHGRERQGICNIGSDNNDNDWGDHSESRVGERTNHVGKSDSSPPSARPRENLRKSKKQKVDKGNDNDNRTPPRQQFSQEALQKLEDFERRLVRLLGTLPSQEIPLSQLPKEYEKTWGGSRNSSSRGTTAMIRPREYRCKKLGFLLEKHCSRTVEVVQKTKPAASSSKEKAGAAMWVRLKAR
jgi:ankyrin repeat protein